MSHSLEGQLAQLERTLRSYGKIALGFSGGVDSTFLAAVCARCMPEQAILVHLTTPLIGTPEQSSFEREAGRFGLPVFELKIDPLANPAVASNPKDRCYHCKHAGFGAILQCAREQGCDAVIDGSNADDLEDYRPGMRACDELGVRSPLQECGWRKEDERTVLRAWGYAVWDMPAGACLATRIPCGEPLTAAKLDLVRACEDHLHGLGLTQVRARLAGDVLRLQAAPADLARLAAMGTASAEGAGAARSDHAVEVTGPVPLPDAVKRHLRELGATDIDPIATPYAHGSMNG